jgi:exosortase/archaeosortase family protein
MFHRPMSVASFLLRGVAGSVGLFSLLRLPWTEAHIVLPLIRLQSAIAVALLGAPAVPVAITSACSGTDAVALCLGAVLAYPVPWRTRMKGAAAGTILIFALNTLRVGTLGRASASPWFTVLHLYVWPGALTVVIAAYVFTWMRRVDRRPTPDDARSPQDVARRDSVPVRPVLSRRFILIALIFMLLFVAASPLYLASPMLAALAAFIAGAAATTLSAVGVNAHAAGPVLWTSNGGFLVTQECIATPLLPVYLAAVTAYAGTWRRLTLGVVAAVPLFIALGIVRLLMVALPDVVASPIFAVHAFYQLLAGVVVVFLAARWRYDHWAAVGHALLGVFVAMLVVLPLGPLYTVAITTLAGAPLEDPQGAISLLPAFQVGLYLALWVAACMTYGWKRFMTGLAGLAMTQAAGLLALRALTTHAGLTAQVRDIRGWAVAGPLFVLVAVVHRGRPHR